MSEERNAPSLRDLYVTLSLDMDDFLDSLSTVDDRLDQTEEKMKTVSEASEIKSEITTTVRETTRIESPREIEEEMEGISQDTMDSLLGGIRDNTDELTYLREVLKSGTATGGENLEIIGYQELEDSLRTLEETILRTNLETPTEDELSQLSESIRNVGESMMTGNEREMIQIELVEDLIARMENVDNSVKSVVDSVEAMPREIERSPEEVAARVPERSEELSLSVEVNPTFEVSINSNLDSEDLREKIKESFEKMIDDYTEEIMEKVSEERKRLFESL
jgi:hypothetical protein